MSGSNEEICSTNFLWYPAISIGLHVILLLSNVSIAVHSGKGGVFDTEARKHLPLCCYIRTGKSGSVMYVQVRLTL